MSDLDRALRQLAKKDQALSAPAYVEDAIARHVAEMRRAPATLDAKPGIFEIAPARPRPEKTTPRWLVGAMAAALAIGIYLPLSRMPKEPPASVQPNNAVTAEVGTDYFPLRAGPLLAPGEIGQVIRVPVRSHEMLRMGLPTDIVVSSGAVNADVLIGLDGTARAIRFVR
jgi:hypothetical protein